MNNGCCKCHAIHPGCRTAGVAAIAFAVGIITALILSSGAAAVLLAVCACCIAAVLLK